MLTEVESLVYKIKERTGIDISLFNEKKFFVSTKENYLPTLNFFEFEDFYIDKLNNKTYFKIEYKSQKFIAEIDGVTEKEKTFAELILSVFENAYVKPNEFSEEAFLKNILEGETTKIQIQKYIKRKNIPSYRCFCLIALLGNHKANDVLEILENYSSKGKDISLVLGEDFIVQVKFLDETISAVYQSPTEYAESLLKSVENELGLPIDVAVGAEVSSFLEISTSYKQALSAIKMKESVEIKGEVYSFKGMFLSKILEEMPRHKIEEYLRTLVDDNAKAVFTDSEMILTAEEFLKNDLNFSETSRKLYLHRNTLVYRLDKIQKATGLDIRKFQDAVTFRLITLLYKTVY
ncbi:MAG: hypothetical protein E7342_04115 [Clostridiales bacterium]|nr:hypothetical protein [Clostridiales bacterium]